ncbi:MAG: T9SS type A sorting domain-containing protein, partial [Saprospiraceae bacterium]
ICTPHTQTSSNQSMPGEIYTGTGAVADWRYEIVNLDDYIGQPNVKLKWMFHSNGGLNMQGFNMDDVMVNKLSNILSAVNSIPTSTMFIYPNPANNELSISDNEIMKYTIYSLDGKKHLQGTTANKIDLKNISNGFYMLRLTNATLEEKVMKFSIIK